MHRVTEKFKTFNIWPIILYVDADADTDAGGIAIAIALLHKVQAR